MRRYHTRLKKKGMLLNLGCRILAEMSSKGSQAVGGQTAGAVSMASRHSNFVIGLIGQSWYFIDRGCLLLTPGVALESGGDTLWQQYCTPAQVVQAGVNITMSRGSTGPQMGLLSRWSTSRLDMRGAPWFNASITTTHFYKLKAIIVDIFLV